MTGKIQAHAQQQIGGLFLLATLDDVGERRGKSANVRSRVLFGFAFRRGFFCCCSCCFISIFFVLFYFSYIRNEEGQKGGGKVTIIERARQFAFLPKKTCVFVWVGWASRSEGKRIRATHACVANVGPLSSLFMFVRTGTERATHIHDTLRHAAPIRRCSLPCSRHVRTNRLFKPI